MELKGKKINFLGDSITEGVGCSDPANKVYHQLLKKSAGLAEARNYGVSGTRLATQTNEYPDHPEWGETFLERAKKMDKDADIVVVFGGTNDFGHGDASIGTSSDRTPNTFYGACHALYSYLVTEFPAAQIVIMTPLHRLFEDNTNGDGHQKAYNYGNLHDYVNIIREVAEYYSLPVLDLYKEGGIQPNVPSQCEMFTVDGLHPNDAGYERIARKLEAFLRAL